MFSIPFRGQSLINSAYSGNNLLKHSTRQSDCFSIQFDFLAFGSMTETTTPPDTPRIPPRPKVQSEMKDPPLDESEFAPNDITSQFNAASTQSTSRTLPSGISNCSEEWFELTSPSSPSFIANSEEPELGVDVHFQKVEAHSGIYGNELVDKLAQDALRNYVKERDSSDGKS